MGIFFVFLTFRKKCSVFHPLSVMLAVGFLTYSFYQAEVFFQRAFTMKAYCILSTLFPAMKMVI